LLSQKQVFQTELFQPFIMVDTFNLKLTRMPHWAWPYIEKDLNGSQETTNKKAADRYQHFTGYLSNPFFLQAGRYR
jgi:hypothetical protein